MTRASRIIASIVAVVLLGGAAAAFAVVWRPAIAAVEPPAPQAFDAALVKRGRELAAIGNCNNCHTAGGGSGSFHHRAARCVAGPPCAGLGCAP